MQLEKIVTDWYTFYCKPTTLNEMKNCIIYISAYNIECFKKAINKIINNRDFTPIRREIELQGYEKIISFIRKNSNKLNKDYMQTDELEFIKENNSYIVVVKETKDIRTINDKLKDKYIEKEENDTVFIGLLEEAQILTIKDTICELISEYEIPVFCLNIKNVE